MFTKKSESCPSPLVFDVGQIAEMLGVSRKTVLDLGKRGLLVPVNFGSKKQRVRRYTAKSVFALLENHQEGR